MSLENMSVIELILIRYCNTNIKANDAMIELNKRGYSKKLAETVKFIVLPFIAIDRLFAIHQADDKHSDFDFDIKFAIKISFIFSLPLIVITAGILYTINASPACIAICSLLSWPAFGALVVIAMPRIYGEWWL